MKRRKKILVNASTVLISGGYYLSFNIISALIKSNSLELFIVCPSYKKYKSLATENSHLILVPRWQLRRYFRLFLDRIWLPQIIKRINPELVYSLCNFPARTYYPQIHLHDNPYFLEEKLSSIPLSLKERMLQKIRSNITKRRMHYVDLIIVQSEFHKSKFLTLTDFDTEMKILSPSVAKAEAESSFMNPFKQNSDKINILCLARYYEHKNIEILLKVGQLIKEYKHPFVLYLSLNKNHHKNVSRLLREIEKRDLGEIIVNLGQIAYKNIGNYVKNCDAMILPSLLESFSLNFIEAWAFEKPLFISNTEANESACQKAAFYFDPKNEESILQSLLKLNDPKEINKMISRGNERISALTKWDDYVDVINHVLE